MACKPNRLFDSGNPNGGLGFDGSLVKQNHFMTIGKGRTFTSNEPNLITVEKEAYTIIKACHELEYLLLRLNVSGATVTMRI
ncbi:hypothetical protein PHMEG_00022505 [Phytophthora megakarya]|uniref:Uncharacterized protein n=1 Tax=Phytophthora megakarya TaxID=4795 RepID=A0A225VIJ8_9STRA|nr:hypothetical protein PHMEG_00022505 [Phytophthora megakarya]